MIVSSAHKHESMNADDFEYDRLRNRKHAEHLHHRNAKSNMLRTQFTWRWERRQVQQLIQTLICLILASLPVLCTVVCRSIPSTERRVAMNHTQPSEVNLPTLKRCAASMRKEINSRPGQHVYG